MVNHFPCGENQEQEETWNIGLTRVVILPEDGWLLNISLLAFGHLVCKIMDDLSTEGHRIQALAVAVLQYRAEAFLVGLHEDVNLCTIHTKSITITPKNINLAKCL